ncbi:hypothetical protein VNI00_019177 [Paramarasmius palmivorus]|uniref:Uncharacterized protein n=1 Tax=Paramarasmius palmivorus TaxID=297713 RepID=A0AAW0AQC4_9AGAR
MTRKSKTNGRRTAKTKRNFHGARSVNGQEGDKVSIPVGNGTEEPSKKHNLKAPISHNNVHLHGLQLPGPFKLSDSGKASGLLTPSDSATVIESFQQGSSETIYAQLELTSNMPWREQLKLGRGVDAITWQPRKSAFTHSVEDEGKRITKCTKETYNIITRKQAELSQGGFGIHSGASFTDTGLISAEIKGLLSTMFSTSNSSESFCLHCKLEGGYKTEYPVTKFSFTDKARSLSTQEFRKIHGDYFVSGRERGFSCDILILCQTTAQVDNTSFYTEVTARLQNILHGGIRTSDIEIHSKRYNISNYKFETKGCSTEGEAFKFDTSELQSECSLIATVSTMFDRVKSNAEGVEQVAILDHYTILPRISGIDDELLGYCHDLYHYCAEFKSLLNHLALHSYSSERKKMEKVIKSYQQKSKSLSPTNAHEFKSMYEEAKLLSRLSKKLCRNYYFLGRMRNMQTKIKPGRFPAGRHRTEYEWECGQVGGHRGKKSSREYFTLKLGDIKVCRAKWTSPEITPSIVEKIFGFGQPYMEFRSGAVDDSDFSPDSPHVSSPSRETFIFTLKEGPAYVLGWKLSVNWYIPPWSIGHSPEIRVAGERNGILSENLRIRLDNWTSARWKCEVTFVLKEHFDFPKDEPSWDDFAVEKVTTKTY